MEYVDGASTGIRRCPASDADERAATYRAIVDTLAALHGVDVGAAGLADFGKPATTSRASFRAGASSTAPAAPRRSRRWTR
jgi:aminoglycoside phosphotransferase (APT) family kinase protein